MMYRRTDKLSQKKKRRRRRKRKNVYGGLLPSSWIGSHCDLVDSTTHSISILISTKKKQSTETSRQVKNHAAIIYKKKKKTNSRKFMVTYTPLIYFKSIHANFNEMVKNNNSHLVLNYKN